MDSRYKLYALILAYRLRRWWLERNNKIKRKKGKLYACFVDFKTAFDSVDRKI